MSSSIPDPVPEGATDAQLRHIINYWRVEAIHAQHQRDAAWLAAESGNALVKQLKDQLAEAKAEVDVLREAGRLLCEFVNEEMCDWEGNLHVIEQWQKVDKWDAQDGPYAKALIDVRALQAEVAELNELYRKTADAHDVAVIEFRKVDAENERLRKAGDAMAAIICPPAHGPGEWDGEYDNWQIAKGVQS